MGLLKGTLSFSLYRLEGSLPTQADDFIARQLKAFAFRNISLTSEEKAIGWTSIENVLDTDFEGAKYIWGDYLMLALRVDRKTVPPSLLKIRLLEAEQDFLAETGQKRIYREQRDDLRERVHLELFSKSQPIPAFYEFCWSLSQKTLLLCSLSEKVIDDFQDFFKQTFSLSVYPYTPWDPLWLDEELSSKLALAEKENMPDAAATSGLPAVDRTSLGREFLTWLWFKSEERNGVISLPGTGDIELLLVRRLVLESGDGEYAETVVCQGMHSDLKEGKEALRQGKKIKEARIRLDKDEGTWEFTLKADRFSFQSLKLPVMTDKLDDQEDRDGAILERIYLVETATKTMTQLFRLFLEIRLSPNWLSTEAPRIKNWLQQQ
ncbi:MAG: recombination associated protein [Syntrophus sp. PtaB.Bin001]|nr:MAG: recombination associated protein [Syntrophus sp. PtaB.Bin001]